MVSTIACLVLYKEHHLDWRAVNHYLATIARPLGETLLLAYIDPIIQQQAINPRKFTKIITNQC